MRKPSLQKGDEAAGKDPADDIDGVSGPVVGSLLIDHLPRLMSGLTLSRHTGKELVPCPVCRGRN